MDFLDIFSLIVLLVIIGVFVAIILVLAWLPGNIARKRHSPWAEAINVAGWIGIVLFPIWMLALIWAFYKPRSGQGAAIAITEPESAELATSLTVLGQRIGDLETSLRNLRLRSSDTSTRR
ncbi:MAG TPA: DUF3302 domain-containing protein [Candidatus Saccharimonadales bacterium]|nr:DUF3302 domain-containing protein [Candidatus Saccharimonadales bacterium]